MKPLLVLSFLAGAWTATAAAQDVKSLLDRVGSSKGLCVVLGDAEGKLAVELARKSDVLSPWLGKGELES